mgnify:CR=1 FL=1
MPIQRATTSTAAALGQNPAQNQSSGTPDAPLATAMPGGSSRLSSLTRLHRNAQADGHEASSAGRPRAPLKLLARVGLGLASLGFGAAALTGCSSGSSGLATRSAEPTSSPSSAGQTIDPAPSDSSTASTKTTDPSTSASSPTDLPTIVGQGNTDVALVKMQLDTACGFEADTIASQPRPTNDTLGQLYDRISAATQGLDYSGGTTDAGALHKLLDSYLNEEEALKKADPSSPPESSLVQQARRERMDDDVLYRQALYQQNPTQDNRAEWAAANDAETEALTDGLISPKQSGDALQDGWPLPS